MKNYLSLIKFSHTIFALPFALLGFFLATAQTGRAINWIVLAFVLGCMIFARSAAMAFNRYLDRDIDKKNPRTAVREIPAGIISPKAALAFVIANSVLFIATTYLINSLCFYLSPIALLVILGYSYTKRFTALCHFVLGLGLALAPVGAYLAVTATFAWLPVIYGGIVLCWVAGFDIIYALQDEDFDKQLALKSIPVYLGTTRALYLSTFLHILCGALLLLAGFLGAAEYESLHYIHWIGVFIFLVLLSYQHFLVKPNDLSRVNIAFFTTNGIASILYCSFVVIDLLV